MEIIRNLDIKVTEIELKEIVAAYLNREGYDGKSENVQFHMGSELEGYGLMEHEVTKFKGCTVTCRK